MNIPCFYHGTFSSKYAQLEIPLEKIKTTGNDTVAISGKVSLRDPAAQFSQQAVLRQGFLFFEGQQLAFDLQLAVLSVSSPTSLLLLKGYEKISLHFLSSNEQKVWLKLLAPVTVQCNYATKYKAVRELQSTPATRVLQIKTTDRVSPKLAVAKYFHKARNDIEDSIVPEIEAMWAARCHPNLVTLQEIYEQQDYVILVSDHIEGLDLKRTLLQNPVSISIVEIYCIIRGVLQGLAAIHSSGLVHGNVRPVNVVLKKPFTCKPADVVLTSFENTRCKNGIKIRPIDVPWDEYTAPELLKDLSLNNFCTLYTEKSDVFSLGKMISFILRGHFPDGSPFSNFQPIIREYENSSLKSIEGLDADLLDLLHNMLKPNPISRFTAKECLAHCVFTRSSCNLTRYVENSIERNGIQDPWKVEDESDSEDGHRELRLTTVTRHKLNGTKSGAFATLNSKAQIPMPTGQLTESIQSSSGTFFPPKLKPRDSVFLGTYNGESISDYEKLSLEDQDSPRAPLQKVATLAYSHD